MVALDKWCLSTMQFVLCTNDLFIHLTCLRQKIPQGHRVKKTDVKNKFALWYFKTYKNIFYYCHIQIEIIILNSLFSCNSGKSQPSPSELLDRGGPPAGLDSYLNKANYWLSGKKDAAERLLKNTSKTDVRGFFGGLESKLRSSVAPKTQWANAQSLLYSFH